MRHWLEYEYSLTVRFLPARGAPACSNPNSPAFSDDGDPAELIVDTSDLPEPLKTIFDEAMAQAENDENATSWSKVIDWFEGRATESWRLGQDCHSNSKRQT